MNKAKERKLASLLRRAANILEGKPAREATKMLTLLETARLLNVSSDSMRTDIAAGRIDPPSHVAPGGRRPHYHPADLPKLRAHFATRPDMAGSSAATDARRAAGYYSIRDLAAAAGIVRVSVVWHQKCGRLAPPSHTYHGCAGRFYDQKEFDSTLAFLAAWRKEHPAPNPGRPRGSAPTADDAELVSDGFEILSL